MFPKLGGECSTSSSGTIVCPDDTGSDSVDTNDSNESIDSNESGDDTQLDSDSGDTSDTAETGDTGSVPFDADGDSYTNDVDCDDGDASVYPGAPEDCAATRDYNCDGLYGSTDNDGDGFAACLECDDTNSAVNPNATETCNDGVDDDCDGLADDADAEGVVNTITWYLDVDSDGYGDSATSLLACNAPVGYVDNPDDCDDGDVLYHPGASETCTDTDDFNCDGSIGAVDGDADGWFACEECDDGDAAVNPDALEMCNGVDDDCDGYTDDSDPDGVSGTSTWYADLDLDGYGDSSTTILACDVPSGYVDDNKDCDDGDSAVNPFASETCVTDYDDDCDGDVDDALDMSLWHYDGDSDGYGDPSTTVNACEAPTGYISENTDCDDSNSAVNPSGTETCNDGVDDDCDSAADDLDAEGATGKSTWYTDADSDSFGDPASGFSACEQYAGTVADVTDCDDSNNAVNPSAEEMCNSGMDDDCDGYADEADSSLIDASVWYADLDSDSYGDADVSQAACSQPSGYVASSTDCDDGDGSISPAATETCDGEDDNCDGSTDEGVTTTYYLDFDVDGYGDATVSQAACSQPSGYVTDNTDCNDAAWDINPGYPFEGCNGVDDDCDGLFYHEDPDSAGSGYSGACTAE